MTTMERINIAEILRDCPRGMELDCPCFENVRFDHVDAKDRIRCLCGPTDDEVSFTAYGTLNNSPMAKVVLFPKGKERWEKEKVEPKFDLATLKPFDKVLVRDDDSDVWGPSLYGSYIPGVNFPYICIGDYMQCIPYEGNEHLLGTTDDCDEHYKTWED